MENEISAVILDAAIAVHRELGPGLLEGVYERALAHLLERRGLHVERQVAVPVVFDGVELGEAFRADLLVEGRVIVEVKSVERLAPVHCKQVLTYLRLSKLRLGVLVNFNEALLKDGYRRIVNHL